MSAQISPKAPLHPLLAQYLVQLATNPLRTKAITSATFSFLQEVIGSNAAGLPPNPTPKDASALSKALACVHINTKAFKMALYGFFVSAPLGHFLVGFLQKSFAGKVGLKYRLAQVLANNLLVAPIQTTAYLASMAVINGAKSFEDVARTVKAGFFAVIRVRLKFAHIVVGPDHFHQVTWIVSPLSMVVAQQFIPVELWVPFFNIIQFALGTLVNIKMKKLRLAAAKKEEEQKERDRAASAAAKAE
ncbi:hypothetical protein J3R82DRAFT_655 [Butyriboletus roseoflavus]|nr:hypothetical protein J3R82DRAFT_655 [Butyriboletus roseoflavus]